MNKHDVLRITEEYNLAPNKKLGQNFLINDSTIMKIIDSAVELDSGFFKYLTVFFSDRDNVRLVHSDFLRVELDDEFDVIVSNLPYYCASEILFRIASQFTVPDLYVMVQKEMGDRMAASCGTGNYGAMSVTLSYYFDIKLLFYVPGESFFPRPDVKSSFLKLSRKERMLDEEGETLFHLIVKSAFWGRRKTILKALSDSPHMNYERVFLKEALESCGIDSSIRGENLGLTEYINLTEAVKNNEK